MRVMGNLYDYFTAVDDAAASSADLPGGPAALGLDTLETKGVEPAVQMATLDLGELAELARRALARGHRLYYRWSL
jgi:hypothetical protein